MIAPYSRVTSFLWFQAIALASSCASYKLRTLHTGMTRWPGNGQAQAGVVDIIMVESLVRPDIHYPRSTTVGLLDCGQPLLTEITAVS